MVIDTGAPEYLWGEALITASYITNRLRPGKDESSPMEQWNKGMKIRQHQTSLAHLQAWYCKAYVNIPPEKRIKSKKMRPHAWLGYLVGYTGEHGHLFKIYDPITKKVSTHRDVVFWETKSDDPNMVPKRSL